MAETVKDNSTEKFGTDAREKLRQHFHEVPVEEYNTRWDTLYDPSKDNFLPWDRGTPNPALVDALTDRQDLLGSAMRPDGKTRKKALVPGCGKGYDVLLLAAMGYDAYGLEISQNALNACNDLAAKKYYDYTKYQSQYGAGSYSFILGDFFKDDFLKDISLTGFDLIYDYTVSQSFVVR